MCNWTWGREKKWLGCSVYPLPSDCQHWHSWDKEGRRRGKTARAQKGGQRGVLQGLPSPRVTSSLPISSSYNDVEVDKYHRLLSTLEFYILCVSLCLRPCSEKVSHYRNLRCSGCYALCRAQGFATWFPTSISVNGFLCVLGVFFTPTVLCRLGWSQIFSQISHEFIHHILL